MAAVAFLGERFTVINAVGLCILIAGVVLFNYLKYRKMKAGELAVHPPPVRKAPIMLSPRRSPDSAHLLVRSLPLAAAFKPTSAPCPDPNPDPDSAPEPAPDADCHHSESSDEMSRQQQYSSCMASAATHVTPCCTNCRGSLDLQRLLRGCQWVAQADESDGECSTPPPGKLSTPVLRNPTSTPSPFAFEAATSGDSPQSSRLIDPSERGHLRQDVL